MCCVAGEAASAPSLAVSSPARTAPAPLATPVRSLLPALEPKQLQHEGTDSTGVIPRSHTKPDNLRLHCFHVRGAMREGRVSTKEYRKTRITYLS